MTSRIFPFRWRSLAVVFALITVSLAGVPVRAQEAAPPAPVLKVFSLQSADANALGELVENIYGEKVGIAMDVRTNSLIVQGDENTLEEIGALLLKLDSEPTVNAVAEATELPPVQVRVFWLMTGAGDVEPPQGLQPVVDEVKELGIENLKLAGQMSINVSGPGSEFSIRSRPIVDQRECVMDFTGMVRTGNANRPLLQGRISCQTTPTTDVEGVEIASMESMIDAPLGQYIVLGTTTTGGANSVFVLQLVPKK